MNKLLSSFWSLLLLAATVATTSCGTDAEDVTPAAPSISLSAADQTGATVNTGQTVTFVVNVTAPGNFASMRVDKTVGTGTTTTFDEVVGTADQTTYAYPFEYTPVAADAGKVITFDFEVTDGNAKVGSHTYEITVNDNPIASYQAVLLGGQNNGTLGSFYNAKENVVYKYAEASTTANKSKVDLVFYYATNGTTPSNATIAAPSNASARTAFSAATSPMSLDGMNNATYFVPTTAAFNEVTTSTGLENAYIQGASTNAPDTRITNLDAGQVFAFQLDEPRGYIYGLAEVVSVQGADGTTRKITLNIKAQTVSNN